MIDQPIRLYCRDCVHSIWTGPPIFTWVCGHAHVQRDLVNGWAPNCANVRKDDEPCGPSGALFTPKPIAPPIAPAPRRHWLLFWRRA